jgi:hypothetical protein
MKYQIKISYPSGIVAYMIHKDKQQWCKRTAQKYIKEFVMWHGLKVELEKV